MPSTHDLRELLIADLAVVRGVADAADVAAALQRRWGRTDEPRSFTAELLRIADLEPGALDEIVAETDGMIEEADGDAGVALSRHGGLDRSLPAALASRGGRTLRGTGGAGCETGWAQGVFRCA